MAYRKRTLRTMSPTARDFARLIGELESIARRMGNRIPDLQQLDLDSQALHNHQCLILPWLSFEEERINKELLKGLRRRPPEYWNTHRICPHCKGSVLLVDKETRHCLFCGEPFNLTTGLTMQEVEEKEVKK